MTADSANSRPTYWITRTEPDNARTAERLLEMGCGVLTVPVLSTCALQWHWPAEMPEAVVFTSPNGVRYHQPRPELLDHPIFTVGDRTALAASSVGYRDVRSADGDVRNLEYLICSAMPPEGTILHLCARQPAGDLVGNLNRVGYDARRVAVYETRAVPVAELLEALPPLENIGGILVHSPRAGRNVREVIDGSPVCFTGTIYCISRAAAAPFRGLRDARIAVADRPNEDAMLHLIQDRNL